MSDTTVDDFAGWFVIELFGKQRIAGYVSVANVAGTAFFRIDVPDGGGQPAVTRFYSPSAVFAFHPSDEATIRRVISALRPAAPVHRWELPAAAADVDECHHTHDDDGSWR